MAPSAPSTPDNGTSLAKLALAGRAAGLTIEDGMRLLATAAENGDGEADAMIAVLVAIGARSIEEWDQAFDYLGRSAARGFAPARAQLALFCKDRELVATSKSDSPPQTIWKRMKEAIDVATVLAVPPPRIVRFSPHVAVFEGFAAPAECAWLIDRAMPHLERAQIFESGGPAYAEARTNSAMQFDILKTDLVLVALHARIVAASGFGMRCLEETNVLHYAAGQEFSRHCDFFPHESRFEREIAERGQRAATLLVYLNEGYEGGETAFERFGWHFKGRPGDALFFRNLVPSGEPDHDTLHAGLPPKSGEKWLLSQWIRTHPPRTESSAMHRAA